MADFNPEDGARLQGAANLALDGRHAFVTGAGRGIGVAIVHLLADRGATITLGGRDAAALEATAAALSTRSHVALADVTDEQAFGASVVSAEAALGPIDILVNNAGIAGVAKPTWEYTDEDWQSVVDLNLTAVFNGCRALIPHMRASGYGRIVSLASIAGKEGNPNASAYSATKAGVIGLTKTLGKELAESGVIVNCVTPAAIRTDIFDQITQDHIDYMLSKIPMGRLGRVEEAAALIAWLASEDCSFSTGAVFDLSGGRATY